MRPAAQSLSLTRQRKEPKKATPTSATPALRFGANLRRSACGVRGGTRCVRCALFAQTSPASQTTKRVHAALHTPPRKRRAAGAASRGWKTHTGHRCARPWCRLLPGPSAAMARVGVELPSGRAEKRRAWGGHGEQSMPMRRGLTCCGCLSAVNEVNAASSAAPPQARASQAARSEAKGHGQRGRLFFAYLLLATQKNVGAPPGAHPGQRKNAAPTKHRTTANNSDARCPSPQPSPQRGEGARQGMDAPRSSSSAGKPRIPTRSAEGRGIKALPSTHQGLIYANCSRFCSCPMRATPEGVKSASMMNCSFFRLRLRSVISHTSKRTPRAFRALTSEG